MNFIISEDSNRDMPNDTRKEQDNQTVLGDNHQTNTRTFLKIGLIVVDWN